MHCFLFTMALKGMEPATNPVMGGHKASLSSTKPFMLLGVLRRTRSVGCGDGCRDQTQRHRCNCSVNTFDQLSWLHMPVGINTPNKTHNNDLQNSHSATCYTSLTVNHILIECPQFNHLRQQYHISYKPWF